MTPEESYRATVRELQNLAERASHVTQQDVLDIASMPVDELRRRALVARDWHGHFAHALDGIKELRVMPGAAPDGCWSPRQVRSVVLTLVESCAYTWEDDFRGRLKTPAPSVPVVVAVNPAIDRGPCTVCGVPWAKHGTAPTCASHDYTPAGTAGVSAAHSQTNPPAGTDGGPHG